MCTQWYSAPNVTTATNEVITVSATTVKTELMTQFIAMETSGYDMPHIEDPDFYVVGEEAWSSVCP